MNTMRDRLILLGLFLGVPAGMLALLTGSRARMAIPVMLVVALGCVLSLARETRRSLWNGEAWQSQWRGILIRFLVGGAVLAVVTKICVPWQFLSLPLQRPRLWLVVCVLYPLFSVCPQELIYRVFFFDQAARAFPGTGIRRLIVCNALLFGYVHIVFGNVWAPLMAIVGGLMFACTYCARRSFLCAVVEHTIWGDLIFTLGLGQFFAGGTVAKLLMK